MVFSIHNKNITYPVNDWSEHYSNKITSLSNKSSPVNRWFPIVEGFSEDFVRDIIDDMKEPPKHCLDPFAGGGTTPFVCQINGIKCTSFEINPFFSQICRAKLRNDYIPEELTAILAAMESFLRTNFNHGYNLGLKTLKKSDKNKKWLYHKTALNSLLSIKKSIDDCSNSKYQDLLSIVLGSIALEFSNVFRDGKALKYRVGWNKRFHRRKKIYSAFFEKCRNQVLPDIELMNKTVQPFDNLMNLHAGDSRILINNLEPQSIDLVITSPPYLNSRDYTDAYMIELWLLNHVESYEDLRVLRKSTLRSHVQVTWENPGCPNVPLLKTQFKEIMEHEAKFWNRNIPSMINGYFADIENLLKALKPKMVTGGKLYINVANSAYFGVIIETDRIIAHLAENIGYSVKEIRLARMIKTSSQQINNINKLRESIIVLVS